MKQTIIAVINQKGGVGKTTTAVSLAAQLATANEPVLLVDLDPQGNATSGLGLDKEALELTSYDVLFGRAPLDQAVQPSGRDGLVCLAGERKLGCCRSRAGRRRAS